jgi:hypothetical protein
MSNFRKGLEGLQQASERSGPKTFIPRRYLKWESGEEKTIRFLSEGDSVVQARFHEWVPTHDGGRRSFVCRTEVNEECELCANPDVKAREVGMAVAVVRLPVKDESGKTVGFKDATEEVDLEEDGKVVHKTVPVIGIIQQSPKNFWASFWAAYDKYGTLRDRDYSVTRRGSGMDTMYVPFQEEPEEIPNLDSRYAKYVPDLEAMLTSLSSKEYYDKHLHGIESEKTPAADSDLDAIKRNQEQIAANAVSGDYE